MVEQGREFEAGDSLGSHDMGQAAADAIPEVLEGQTASVSLAEVMPLIDDLPPSSTKANLYRSVGVLQAATDIDIQLLLTDLADKGIWSKDDWDKALKAAEKIPLSFDKLFNQYADHLRAYSCSPKSNWQMLHRLAAFLEVGFEMTGDLPLLREAFDIRREILDEIGEDPDWDYCDYGKYTKSYKPKKVLSNLTYVDRDVVRAMLDYAEKANTLARAYLSENLPRTIHELTRHTAEILSSFEEKQDVFQDTMPESKLKRIRLEVLGIMRDQVQGFTKYIQGDEWSASLWDTLNVSGRGRTISEYVAAAILRAEKCTAKAEEFHNGNEDLERIKIDLGQERSALRIMFQAEHAEASSTEETKDFDSWIKEIDYEDILGIEDYAQA